MSNEDKSLNKTSRDDTVIPSVNLYKLWIFALSVQAWVQQKSAMDEGGAQGFPLLTAEL